MTPIEWITFANIAMTLGTKFAVAWSDLLAKAKAGEPVTLAERDAALAKVEYRELVPNTFLPQVIPVTVA